MFKKIVKIKRTVILAGILVIAFAVLTNSAAVTTVQCEGNNCYKQCQQDYLDCVNSGEDLNLCRNTRTTCFFNCP